jgi:hypothetical protein
MAQTGFTPIVTYNTATATTIPSAANLAQGELAVNVTDKKLYTKDSGGNVVLLASNGGDVTGPATSTNLAIPTFSGTGGKTLLDNSGATISAGVITATGFSGPLTGNVTGNVSGSSGSCTGNAATVTTNANLTGPITSVGNATSIASQTGTGTKFVMDTSPTLVTPKSTTTIGVGAATPSASGAGITFPATQSASTDVNTLDDYEEGTWTPVFEGTTGSIGATASTVSGTYTKIGRQVTCYGEIVLTNKGSWTGVVRIAGKPFNSASTYVNVGSATLSNVNYTSGASLAVYMNTSATGFYIDTSSSGGARTVVSLANVANNSEFYFTFTYFTS